MEVNGFGGVAQRERYSVMPLLLYRPMTPCCLVAAWGFALGDLRSGPGDDGRWSEVLRWPVGAVQDGEWSWVDG